MENLNFTELPFDALVAERQFHITSTTLFVSISPNPSTMIECILKNRQGRTRNVKRPYGTLRQDIQYQYCLKCLTEDYFEWLSDDAQLIGIAELNERGNVHLHLLINDHTKRNNVQLQVFQRDILNGWRTQQNIIKRRVNPIDWMNNIVFVTKSKQDILDYFMKNQSEILPRFKNYFLS